MLKVNILSVVKQQQETLTKELRFSFFIMIFFFLRKYVIFAQENVDFVLLLHFLHFVTVICAVQQWQKVMEEKLSPLFSLKEILSEEDAAKMGRKDPEEEVEKFVSANTQELGKDKWLCPLSGKKFKVRPSGASCWRQAVVPYVRFNSDQIKQ